MTPMDNNIHALAGPYALNALDDLERVRFDAHMDLCPPCVVEVAEFLDTTALMASIEDAPVSAAFRANVLTEIDTVRQVGPSRATIRRSAPRLASVAAAVLAVAVVGLSVVTAGLRSEVTDLEDRAIVASVLTAEDAIVLDVDFGDGELFVVASPANGTGVLMASGAAVAPNGHAYQLWLIDGEGNALPGGFLEVGEDGTGEQLMEGDMTGIVAIGITVEPAGGSPTPTTDPVAVAPLTA